MKLVRDNIPDIIRAEGREGEFYIAPNFEVKSRLFDKMAEELEEFAENPCLEEAADMLEVLLALVEIYGMDMQDVQRVAYKKSLTNGSFYRGLVIREPDDSDETWETAIIMRHPLKQGG